MDSFLDVSFAFWRVQKQLRNLEGQGGEFLSGLLLRLCFFLALNQILWDLAFPWHLTSATVTSSPGSVHFLSVGKCSLYHLEKEAPAIRMHSGVQVKRVPKRGTCHNVALGFESWLLTNCLHCYFSGEL